MSDHSEKSHIGRRQEAEQPETTYLLHSHVGSHENIGGEGRQIPS